MDLVSKLIGSYSSVYTFIQRYDDSKNKLENLKKRKERLLSLPRNTLEEKKEYIRQRDIHNRYTDQAKEEWDQWLVDLKTQHSKIYKGFLELNDLIKATIQFGTKRDRDALLYDILISDPRDDSRLQVFLNFTGMTHRRLQEFIAKNDIYQRAEMLGYVEGDNILDPNYIKSVEMARSLVKLFPNNCFNIQYLYKVNDLEGVDSFLKETKCSKEDIKDEFVYSLVYINDITAYKHLLRKAELLGIEMDPEEYIYNALENRNPSIPIYILDKYGISEINTNILFLEMRSEVLQYILENDIRIDLDSLFNDRFVLTSVPSDYLQRRIKELDLSEHVKYIIV